MTARKRALDRVLAVPEADLHRLLVEWLNLTLGPAPKWIFFHPANGGIRHKGEAGRMKAMGVKPGVPDLVFVWPGGGVGFVEIKADRSNARLTQTQSDFKTWCLQGKVPWALVTCLEGLIEVLKLWGLIDARNRPALPHLGGVSE